MVNNRIRTIERKLGLNNSKDSFPDFPGLSAYQKFCEYEKLAEGRKISDGDLQKFADVFDKIGLDEDYTAMA